MTVPKHHITKTEVPLVAQQHNTHGNVRIGLMDVDVCPQLNSYDRVWKIPEEPKKVPILTHTVHHSTKGTEIKQIKQNKADSVTSLISGCVGGEGPLFQGVMYSRAVGTGQTSHLLSL